MDTYQKPNAYNQTLSDMSHICLVFHLFEATRLEIMDVVWVFYVAIIYKPP